MCKQVVLSEIFQIFLEEFTLLLKLPFFLISLSVVDRLRREQGLPVWVAKH